MTKVRFLKNQSYSVDGRFTKHARAGFVVDLPDHSLKSLFDVGAIEIVEEPVKKEEKAALQTKEHKTVLQTKQQSKGKGNKTKKRGK